MKLKKKLQISKNSKSKIEGLEIKTIHFEEKEAHGTS